MIWKKIQIVKEESKKALIFSFPFFWKNSPNFEKHWI
jgi:hypothetical protein